MIEVTNHVRAFPEPGEGNTGIKSILVKSHWNDPAKIIIMVEGCSVTVFKKDILAAISNASNMALF